MADEEKEEVVAEEPQEAQETPQEPSEEKEVGEPTPAPETPSEAAEEPTDVPPPEWMQMLFAPQQEGQPEAEAKPKEEPAKLDLEDTLLTENELAVVQQIIERERVKDQEEIERLRAHITQFVGRDVGREVRTTVAQVYDRTYNGIFKNDPTFRADQRVAQTADAVVQNWCRLAAARAHETGDTSGLEFARTPEFGKAALYLAKLATGTDSGTSPTVIPKGAEVESASTGAQTKPAESKTRIRLTKEERAEMERMGITDKEIEEAQKLKASMGAL